MNAAQHEIPEEQRTDYLGSDQRQELLRAERELLGWDKQPACTLALSGGGIRSAAFSLGVLHALMAQQAEQRKRTGQPEPGDHAVVDCFDYQSTVSGGGFLGATLLWLRYLGHSGQLQAPAMRMLGRFDSGARLQKPGTGTAPATPPGAIGNAPGADPDRERYDWLDFIRLHGNYLKPPSISKAALFAVVLRNMVIAGGAYFTLLLCAMYALIHYGVIGQPDSLMAASFPWLVGSLLGLLVSVSVSTYFAAISGRTTQGLLALLLIGGLAWLLWQSRCAWPTLPLQAMLTAAPGVLLLLTTLALLGSLLGGPQGARHYRWRFRLLQGSGYLLTVFVGSVVLLSLHAVAEALPDFLKPEWLGGAGALLGAAGSVFQFVRGPERRRQQPSRLRSIGLKLLVAIFVYSLLLLAYHGVAERQWLVATNFWPVLGVALALSLLMHSDYLSIGRVYRDRLAEAFMPEVESFSPTRGGPQWNAAVGADQLALQTFAEHPELARPFPLINCHVVLSSSGSSLFHGRGGDSFVMSPLYSGSDATGWISTEAWTRGDPLSLATATAISGAAFSPRTSDGSIAWLKDSLVSLLLSFFHLRLGTWMVNPRRHRRGPQPAWRANFPLLKPNLLVPGLQQGLLGAGLHESAPWIDVTDGGHFENLGIYELVRRKARYIVSIAGSCDVGYHQLDLANALQRCRTDFGAHFTWRKDYEPRLILPIRNELPMTDCFDRSLAVADRAFALAEIRYDDGSEGLLLYLQSTIIADLPPEVESYKREFAAFPNQSTLDQFFDERQFEAYRELGYCLGVSVFKRLDAVVRAEIAAHRQIPEEQVDHAAVAAATGAGWAQPSVAELRRLLRIGTYAPRSG